MNPLSNVKSWLYHLGEADAARRAEIGTSDSGLVVIDYALGDQTPYTRAQLDEMRGDNNKLMVSYLSVGEAEQYRSYWQPSWKTNPPSFIAEANPEWTDNFKVAYWDTQWKSIIMDYVDDIIAGGFNGVYLDIIDAYGYWEEKAPRADNFYRDEMVKFVGEIRAYAKEKLAAMGDTRDFVIIGQNGEDLVDDPAYLQAIDGIGKEDLYFYYPNGSEGSFGPVPNGWLIGSQELLEKAEAAGVEVFAIEYIPPRFLASASAELQKEIAYLKELGIPLYVAEERDLAGIYDFFPTDGNDSGGGTPGIARIGSADADVMKGGAGDDTLSGRDGDDKLLGVDGNDSLKGENGSDTLYGGDGGDTLDGGTGSDRLFGGNGADILYGRKGDDRIKGSDGDDLVDGGEGSDQLLGGNGMDDLFGGDQNDRLNGGAGDDLLQGGKGADRMTGGAGDDELSGGAGNDTFIFKGSFGYDVISDFRLFSDRLSVTDAGDYSIRNVNGGCVIEFDSGSAIELTGITASQADMYLI